ncbi:hypothetical protein N7462_004557 [Penicillium macrosclerotiorum]|uniref:uncharacterized protein n=1 Tax=Penicillium macrosclerotiorum TaxID=303699 RepID=UPI002547B3E1|nr:uncharacterized protein N7462_004557 [Penicillium macrosclerotiorum]KAJ5690165.1 hypothetical protein N7462_004557 [Penicillium macrosclerotiorum]
MTDPRSAGLVGSLPQTTFLEALHRLSPTHFVDPFRKLHHPVHSWAVVIGGLKRVEEIFDAFVKNLFTITRFRTAGGHQLLLAEYTHLLDCARSMGNGVLADQLWELMKAHNVVPDAVCYNHYMEAKIWDHCYTGAEAYRIRMLPHHYRKRRSDEPNVGWQGFGTAQRSVRKLVLRLFGEMQELGYLGDERTYINVMLAAARVGHRTALTDILKKVWNVDVNTLKEEPDNARVEPATPYDPWSALYPTEKLLFAVAHALGTTNDIPGAIRAVQFISWSYDIPISERVWLELFERTYVLSRYRGIDDPESPKARRVEEANTIGKVSRELVWSVFDTMTSEPYNVTPTLQVWRFMVNTGIDNGSLDECQNYLRGAYDLLSETRKKEAEARCVILRCLIPAAELARQQVHAGAARPDPTLFHSATLADAINAYDLLRLEVWQQVHLLQRALWITMRIPSWKDISDLEWHSQERPRMMEEWRDFIPGKIQLFYSENSGHIDMIGPKSFGSPSWKADSRTVPVRYSTEHNNLFHPVEKPSWNEQCKWQDLRNRYPEVDWNMAPLHRLFTFRLPHTPEFRTQLEKFRNTWVEYPKGHELSADMNPHGRLYGRLAALGMLKSTKRGMLLLDERSWV